MRSFALLVVAMLASWSQAQTRLTFNFSNGATVYTVPPGSYYMDQAGGLTIGATKKVILSPGVVIESRRGGSDLTVWGELEIAGTADNPVVWTHKPGVWSSRIQAATATGSTKRPVVKIDHLIFSNDNSIGLRFDNCDFQIRNSLIKLDGTWPDRSVVKVLNGSVGTIENTIIDAVNNTGTGLRYGSAAIVGDATGIDLVNCAITNTMNPIVNEKQAGVAILTGTLD